MPAPDIDRLRRELPSGAMDALLDRRRFLAIGGLGVAGAAVLAACGQVDSPGIARVGVAPTVTALPAAQVNDVVLLRTASSVEHSIVRLYDEFLQNETLLDRGQHGALIQRLRDDHAELATTMEQLTTAAGGEAWTCSNPRLDEVVFEPIRRAIAGGEATDVLPAVEPSDDPRRDAMNFAHALETIDSSMYQGLMPLVSEPALRQEAIGAAALAARHAALLAITITGAPQGYVNPSQVVSPTESTTTTAAPTTTQDLATPGTGNAEGEGQPPAAATPIPEVYAIPSTFGSLGAVQIVIGRPNESGTRLTVNLETPSLNTFVYEYMTPACE